MSLSPTDKKIKELYYHGFTDKQIGGQVDLHQRTVRKHLLKMRKAGFIGYREQPVQKHNKEILKQSQTSHSNEFLNESELIKLLEVYGTRTAVAKRLGVSVSVISRLCDLYKIIDTKRRSELLNETLDTMLKDTKPYIVKKSDKKSKGDTLVVHLTDLHAGKIVKDQEGNIIFDQEIFLKRFDKLSSQILKLLDRNIKRGVKITDVVIIGTGDLANGENIYATQSYEQEFAPPKQVMMVVEEITKLIEAFVERDLKVTFYGVRGNHGRCFSKDTRLLTKEGYKYYNELVEGELIATWNQEKDKVEYKPINSVHIFQNEPEMINFKHKSGEIAVTPDHTLLTYNKYRKKYEKQSAGEIKDKWVNAFPVARPSNIVSSNTNTNPEFLEILGWILADGCIEQKHGYVTIHQSKKENVKRVEYLLNQLDIKYTRIVIDKDTKQTCNVALKTKPKTSVEFKIRSEDSSEIVCALSKNKTILPWMYDLSDKEVNYLLNGIIGGNRCVKPSIIPKHECKTKSETTIWGTKDFLHKLQGLLVTHGKACSVNKNDRGYYLYLRKSNNIFVEKKNVTTTEYNDTSWCVNVDNHIIFTEKNGKPLISGNTGKDTDPAANWDLMIYKILQWYYHGIKQSKDVDINFAETEYMTFEIRGHNYLIRHKAPEQTDTAAGRVKINQWARQHNIEAIVYGHFHHFGYSDCDGTRVFRGPSLVGEDALSEKMSKHSEPAQFVWGVNEKRVSTFVYVADLAD